jgi:hypothetical protein
VRSQLAAAVSEHGARTSSNGADLAVTVKEGRPRTLSPRSPVAEATAADLARTNGSQDASPNVEAVAALPGRSGDPEKAWQPAWPTLDVSETAPAEQERPLHDALPAAAGAAVSVVELEPSTAAAQVLRDQQPRPPWAPRADAAVDSRPRPSSRGGIASGLAAQTLAHPGRNQSAPDPEAKSEASQLQGSEDAASGDERPAASSVVSAVDSGTAESGPDIGWSDGPYAVSVAADGTAAAAVHEQPADINATALQHRETASS